MSFDKKYLYKVHEKMVKLGLPLDYRGVRHATGTGPLDSSYPHLIRAMKYYGLISRKKRYNVMLRGKP